MKWFDRKIIIFLLGIICILTPVLFAIYQSMNYSFIETKNLLLNYANDMLYQADKTGQQIDNVILKLKAYEKQAPCSDSQIKVMRNLDISSTNIQAIGYVKNNKLICSSIGIEQFLGPASLVTSRGTIIRLNVKFPDSDVNFVVIERDHLAVIVHKSLVLETAVLNKDITIGVFSLDNVYLHIERGFVDARWFKKLEGKRQITFLQDGYAIVMIKSKQYPMGVIAAKPFSYINHNTINTALILIPVSILTGLLLTYLLMSWIRQQTSPIARLKVGLRRKEFYLVYQPIYEVSSNRCVGAEVLMRWKNALGEIIPPDEFIPLAEESGLICQLTELLLDLVAKEAKNLFKAYPHFHLAINVSAADLHSKNIINNLNNLILRTNAGSNNLIVEATERNIMNLAVIKHTLMAIRNLGVKVAIDDFGTGYSSLSYLENLELDYLKIDKSFVSAVGVEASTSQVILHIIDMAKALNLQIIAEGVESQEQAEFLRQKGVQFAQGWLYSKPTSLNKMLQLIK